MFTECELLPLAFVVHTQKTVIRRNNSGQVYTTKQTLTYWMQITPENSSALPLPLLESTPATTTNVAVKKKKKKSSSSREHIKTNPKPIDHNSQKNNDPCTATGLQSGNQVPRENSLCLQPQITVSAIQPSPSCVVHKKGI
jgi:hypothetical protein